VSLSIEVSWLRLRQLHAGATGDSARLASRPELNDCARPGRRAGHRIAQPQLHVFELDRADIEAHRRATARWRAFALPAAAPLLEIIDVARLWHHATPRTPCALTIDHRLLAAVQRLHGERRFVDGQELVGTTASDSRT
jgi:hypothetical protein